MKTKNTFVLLDYDGVVSDSEKAMRETFNSVCAKYNIRQRLTQEDFASLFDEDVAQTLLRESGDKEKLSKFLGEMFPKISAAYPSVKIFPEMRAILINHASSPRLSIISSNFSQVIKNHLNLYGINFDENRIMGFEKRIPKEDYLINLIEQNTARDIVIIGDTRGDIRAGNRAGVLTGAVGWGYCTMDELKAENPHYMFETPKLLGKTLDEIL